MKPRSATLQDKPVAYQGRAGFAGVPACFIQRSVPSRLDQTVQLLVRHMNFGLNCGTEEFLHILRKIKKFPVSLAECGAFWT